MLGGTPAQLDAFMSKFDALFKETFTDDGNEFMFSSVIGALLDSRSHDSKSLSNNYVEWGVGDYVGRKLGPQAERYLALHQFLTRTGATADSPFDFQHCDRYGVAFADAEDFKTMALQTQNYTYMVVLCRRSVFHDVGGPYNERGWAWAIHIRVCTASTNDTGWKRAPFTELEWLADRAKVSPDIGYGTSTQDYLRYKDGRDRGYCASIEPDMVVKGGRQTYRVESALARYGFLDGLTYDLASHCDCIDEYEKSRGSA